MVAEGAGIAGELAELEDDIENAIGVGDDE